jgi:hypothetical protein
MKDTIENTMEFAKQELASMNLENHVFGFAFIKLLESAHILSNGDKLLMRKLLEMPKRIYNGFPLSSIQENEFVTDSEGILRHPHYTFAFKDPNTGKYLDQHGIGFVNPNTPDTIVYCRNLELNSVTEIKEFPYYPPAKITETTEV